MTAAPAQLRVDDSMDAVMAKFDETHAWNLPVVDADGKYMGFVSKSKIFNTYRQVLVDFSAE
jgi:CIC family chloride channel protein